MRSNPLSKAVGCMVGGVAGLPRFLRRRRALLMAMGLLLLGTCAILSVLAILVKHEPSSYSRASIPPGKVRLEHSRAFEQELGRLLNALGNRYADWYANFTEVQLNSFFEEGFLTTGVAHKLLPESVTAPRVALEEDRIRLSFRYGTPPWSSIVSITFRVWVAPQEYNVVVLELQSLHAGALPISAQSLLEELSETLRKRNIDVTWYRHHGNPTAALRFQSEQARPSVQLLQLKLQPGTLTISGKSLDPFVPALPYPGGN